MKKMKYLFAGIFAFSVALGVNAQTVDYKEALKPITTALESSSNDPKVLKDLVKTNHRYQWCFQGLCHDWLAYRLHGCSRMDR